CYLANQEQYANWCLRDHSEAYEVVTGVPIKLLGRYYPDRWAVEDIQAVLSNPHEVGNAVAVTCHTWDGSWWAKQNQPG
ncbi:unnamed protein product, partial [marine sediment metagenome]